MSSYVCGVRGACYSLHVVRPFLCPTKQGVSKKRGNKAGSFARLASVCQLCVPCNVLKIALGAAQALPFSNPLDSGVNFHQEMQAVAFKLKERCDITKPLTLPCPTANVIALNLFTFTINKIQL